MNSSKLNKPFSFGTKNSLGLGDALTVDTYKMYGNKTSTLKNNSNSTGYNSNNI
jgi:hypothetical protein